MTNTIYIAIAWIVTIGGIGGYAILTIARGKRLSRSVAPEKRRWM